MGRTARPPEARGRFADDRRFVKHRSPPKYRGVITFYVFFVIELATRRLEIAGTTTAPDEAWMMPVGGHLTDLIDGFLAKTRLLLLDRDATYSKRFCRLLEGAGFEVVRHPARSPNLNAYAERFAPSIEEE